MGTYPLNDELKLINEPVLTIWGTNDGVLDFSKFSSYKSNLPASAEFMEIVGGNNTNFADVDKITGDREARTGTSIQQDMSAKRIDRFITRTSR